MSRILNQDEAVALLDRLRAVIEAESDGGVAISFEQYANILYFRVYDQRGIMPHVDWLTPATPTSLK